MQVMLYLFESFLEKVEQRRFFFDLHELEGDLFEGGASLGVVHRALDVVALLKAVKSLFCVNLSEQKQKHQNCCQGQTFYDLNISKI